PVSPNRCALPMTPLRLTPPSSCAICAPLRPSAHNFFSRSTRSSVHRAVDLRRRAPYSARLRLPASSRWYTATLLVAAAEKPPENSVEGDERAQRALERRQRANEFDRRGDGGGAAAQRVQLALQAGAPPSLGGFGRPFCSERRVRIGEPCGELLALAEHVGVVPRMTRQRARHFLETYRAIGHVGISSSKVKATGASPAASAVLPFFTNRFHSRWLSAAWPVMLPASSAMRMCRWPRRHERTVMVAAAFMRGLRPAWRRDRRARAPGEGRRRSRRTWQSPAGSWWRRRTVRSARCRARY